ncbi:MAG TPA: DUF6298 domain-containing protein [Tepidisphaeraceae bacterium]|nr:DUF6298 domain-containing protein [Tepidisphaeraceae bacterium]
MIAYLWRQMIVIILIGLFGIFNIIAIAAHAAGAAAPSIAIDFSHAGYGAGQSLPVVRNAITVRPSGGDDTELLQAAVDHVAALPADADDYRGAVLLWPGTFRVEGQLLLRGDGIVLRGSRAPGQPTAIVATGHHRRTLIEMGERRRAPTTAPAGNVVDENAPAGATSLTLDSLWPLSPGDRVIITRPSTAEWIADLGMKGNKGPFADQRLDWTPGSRDLHWHRIVTAVDVGSNRITLDAPITTALERRYGGGAVVKVSDDALAHRLGLEDLILDSEFDSANACDEEHAWIAVALDAVEDASVRNVTARHFAGSAVRVGPRARRVTVEGCRSEQPVSEPGGYRRQSFLVEGQQVLVRRCTAEAGMNDFAVGLCAAGPNVFLNCSATGALGPSGGFESWASGALYERVRIAGSGIRLTNDMTRAQGGGWTAGNCVVWNCSADALDVRGPDGAANVVVESAQPLYESQLRARFGQLPAATTVPTTEANIAEFHPQLEANHPAATTTTTAPLQIINGRFVINGRALWGGQVNDGWWKGNANPATALDAGVALTRFVPGRVGPGLTEDLPALAAKMVANGTPFYQSVPGLWYDRRRDEHSIVERTDGNVWAPFYEMPWARSGQAKAWDGLSRFDLTRFNPWYFDRVREFESLCEQRGLLLYHNLYNTHNVLEIGPHWIDYPPRPANCVNENGLPEPPPLEPGNHLHVANAFYDADNEKLRALHRAFIFHSLDELAASPNVIFSLSAQFAGPLKFQQFFQDTVADWQQQHAGRPVRIALVTSKDMTDAILADPVRAKQVAVIDMRYWQYRPDGSLWAPHGGQNLAFREMIAKDFGKMGDAPPPTTPAQLYRQVREYRDRYPDKAIVAWNGGVGPVPILMAGGAQALMRNPSAGHGQGRSVDRTPLDAFVREHLAPVLMTMTPVDGVVENGTENWCLADGGRAHLLLFSPRGATLKFAVDVGDGFRGVWFEASRGETHTVDDAIDARAGVTVAKPGDGNWVLFLARTSS